ncbi:Opi1-domain-containing protein, partial [Aulographum hederae CBS 113979]
MSLQQEHPPAYSHDPDTLQLPSVPRQDVFRRSQSPAVNLPDLKSLGLPPSHSPQTHTLSLDNAPLRWNSWRSPEAQHWQGSAGIHSTAFPNVPATALRSPSDITSPRSDGVFSNEDITPRAPSALSIDDPDVRIAAEALSGLGNPDLIRSPTSRNDNIPHITQATAITNTNGEGSWEDREPILQLVTTNHPWIGGTINGSLSAYNTTKHYSPGFIRSGAEFVERNIGPMANSIGTGLTYVGVEGRVRRYLGDRRPSESDGNMAGHKRRREPTPPGEETDLEKGLQSPRERMRAASQSSFAESLPAYDENRSPQYEERGALATTERPRSSHGWSTQIMITTSGLGVALHDSSLRSLKYTLRVLEEASTRIGNIMRALKMLLEDYERTIAPNQQQNGGSSSTHPQESHLSPEQERASRTIAERIQTLGHDIWQTLRSLVDSVSKYTGGALPENAGQLVRRQLMSLPHRWLNASQSASSQPAASEATKGANRMLAFGKESLEMVEQVTLIVSGTIKSAEQWLDSMGRR